ncbi:MAG: hypothetical protein ACRENG_01250 [bacterium]
MPENQNIPSQPLSGSNIDTKPEALFNGLEVKQAENQILAQTTTHNAANPDQLLADFKELLAKQAEEYRKLWQALNERLDQMLAKLAEIKREREEWEAKREARRKEEATLVSRSRPKTRRRAYAQRPR